MSDEDKDVIEGTETLADSSTEENQPGSGTEEKEGTKTEELDDKGVPFKNRLAEKERLLRTEQKKRLEAESKLTTSATSPDQTTEEEAVKFIKEIADDAATEQVMKRLEPVLIKQFLTEHPDAAEIIEEINQVRKLHPEIGTVDKLELAYGVTKNNILEEKLRQGAIKTRETEQQNINDAGQATVEGSGKSKSKPIDLKDLISKANSVEELQKLETSLTR